ncbi:MAG TPA: hypothetical protein VFF69_14320 [Phycisphaerales bacterium]|nr:hypothetical protein [Phycisphaerales bacterium]
MGDVSGRGFEALRLSILGAMRLLGDRAAYVVCVNSIPLGLAQRRIGPVPRGVCWRVCTRADVPEFLRPHMDSEMAQGVGWKLAPLRAFPDRYEIALDNDCILWELPAVLDRAATGPTRAPCALAEDVRPCFGRFAPVCPARPLNSGIRGLPKDFDFKAALLAALADAAREHGGPVRLTSELDEQGLQAAALSRASEFETVTIEEVTVCSPFHPHLPHLGRCGAHFVGLNARHIPWEYDGRPADAWMAEHWRGHRPALERLAAAGREPSPAHAATP